MAEKSMKGRKRPQAEDFSENIEFSYKGRDYSVPIDGNLVNNLSMEEVKKRLDQLPGKYAYWANMQVEVKRKIQELEEEYDFWYSAVYLEIDAEAPKGKTETWKKNKALLDNSDEYKGYMKRIRDMRDLDAQIEALVKAYNMQQWTLSGIERIIDREFSATTVQARGRGTMSEKGE